MKTTIITSCFESARGEYSEFLKVFDYSAEKHMKHANLILIDQQPDIPQARGNTYGAMTARLNQWAEVVSKVNGNIILADVDVVFLDDITHVFNDYDFDVAYTSRSSKWKPINGGIVFIKDGAQDFVKTWADVNNKMFANKKLHDKWRKKYPGMNQPALGYLIENQHKHKYKMIDLPCEIYNACDQEWKHIDGNTKVLHLKRALRKAIENNEAPAGAEKALKIWEDYRNESDRS